MKSIISEGKTSNEAIEKGLKELGCRREDVVIKVIENEDKRSFFSILEARTVKVELTVKENAHHDRNMHERSKPQEERVLNEEDYKLAKEDLETFLKDFVSKFEGLSFSIMKDNNIVSIKIEGEGSSKLIGYRGDIINALQTVLSAIGNKRTNERVKISLDICNYKEKREETLKELARKLEKTVTRTGKKVILEPMSAYERKILHTELQGSKTVTTYSIGEEPRRKLVVEKK